MEELLVDNDVISHDEGGRELRSSEVDRSCEGGGGWRRDGERGRRAVGANANDGDRAESASRTEEA